MRVRAGLLAVALGAAVSARGQTVSSAVDPLDPDRPEAQRMSFEDPVPEPRLGLLGDADHAFALAAIEAGMREVSLEALESEAAAPRLRSLPMVGTSETRRRDALGRFFESGIDGLVLRPYADEARFQSMLDVVEEGGTSLVFLFEAHPGKTPLAVLRVDDEELARRAAGAVLEAIPEGERMKVGVLSEAYGDEDAALARAVLIVTLKTSGKVDEVVVRSSAPEPGSALEVLEQTTTEDLDDEIGAWIFLGPWPLLGNGLLPWEPEEKFVVAVGARPDLMPAMQAGSVDALVAPDYFNWGRLAGQILLGHLVEAIEVPEGSAGAQAGPIQVIPQADFAATLERWGRWLR